MEAEVSRINPATTRRDRERVLAAPLLALLAGPMGHIAIGYWRRACGWCAVGLLMSAASIASIHAGRPEFMWAVLAAAVVLRISVVADVVRLPRIHARPRWRPVAFIGIGFAIFYWILSMKVQTDFVEALQMPSASMSPTLEIGDHFFVRKSSPVYRRGDVVVFGYPPEPTTNYIKRIVGVGGDVIAITGGHLSINGRPIERQRVAEPCSKPEGVGRCSYWHETLDGKQWLVTLSDEPASHDFPPISVPEGTFFVLGDNRDESSDSRMWGPVEAKLLRGQPLFIWWSWGPTGFRPARINQQIH